jgi:hypothetical protein
VPTLLTARTASTATQHTLSSPCLRTWLREDWAMLFSNPDDFVSYDFEMDRWLVITRRAFAERHIRPIALASPTRGIDLGWVTQLSGDERTVLLEDPAQQHFGPVDLEPPLLRERIEQSDGRFVMFIDNALRIRREFTYRSLADLPSPLELLGWADTLRSRQTENRATPIPCPSSVRGPPPQTRHPAVCLYARTARARWLMAGITGRQSSAAAN